MWAWYIFNSYQGDFRRQHDVDSACFFLTCQYLTSKLLYFFPIQIYDVECSKKSPGCAIRYCGKQDGIHVLSSSTAAGDEIGWNYVNMVMNSQTTISCYHTITQKKYQSCGSTISFMGRTTLTDWLFSWMSSFNIDFREQCYICGENPKVLAGDGTMTGLLFRNAEFQPIEKPTASESHPLPLHRRTQRQFFSYSKDCPSNVKLEKRLAREDLNFFIHKNTNRLKQFQTSVKKSSKIPPAERSEEERRENVLKHAPRSCSDTLEQFMDCSYSHETLQSLAHVLEVCVTEKPISSLINYRLLSGLQTICMHVNEGDSVSFESLENDLPEIYSLYKSSCHDAFELKSVNKFVEYLVSHVQYIHSNDPEIPPAKRCGEYNPAVTGQSYYFTKHGEPVRQMPDYDNVNKTEKDTASCNKYSYAISSKSGSTYLYLIFDPIHYGHCYGFHLIENEGAKDPFSVPFLFMEEAPSEFFCDNSCILEEYALNREPKFYRQCRFYHDVFHGYHHKCPYSYNSRRVPSLSQVNSEICEQFNSYIKKIKLSARAMSQSHFVFYLQFFIHQWNKTKKENYLQKLNVVRSFQSSKE